jgi:uncharacterized membrane protein/uncharacterized protein (DUF952 family)
VSTTPVHFTIVINLVLALIPLLLAIYLFKISHKRSIIWWFLLPVFVAFLPNSAYVLTDIIHFIAAVKSPDISKLHLIFITIPFYIIFLTLTFEFYVLSVQFGQQYLENNLESSNSHHTGLGWLVKVFTPAMHMLSAIGVYLGRFQRLESTDIIHQPIIVFKDLLLDFTQGSSLLIMIGLFCLLAVLYFLVSKINAHVYQRYIKWCEIKIGLNDPYIYLLSSRKEYEQARTEGELVRDSIASEGFIHASPKNQLTRIANKYYKATEQPLVVVVNKSLIKPKVKWEPATGGLYPHIYGAMNASAIIKIVPIALGDDGYFHL